MKSSKAFFILLCILLLLTSGCSSTSSQGVSLTQPEDIADSDVSEDLPENTAPDPSPTENDGIDVDLTGLNANILYAQVYQMMLSPGDYIGKSIKICGQFYALYYEKEEKYYYYVVVSDSAACCSQGFEFLWDAGTHVYPDEYPKDETLIEVTGIFEAYKDPTDTTYYRLAIEDLIVL